jgi:hypothetical protein
MGKGDKRRKPQVSQEVINANWERIRRNDARKKRQREKDVEK